MKSYSISQLAQQFDLSRSTLLYYDRIGLLEASQRSDAGYRQYSESDRERLERICIFRRAGLSLADIRDMLAEGAGPSVAVLEKRLDQLGAEVLSLRRQQNAIAAMLRNMTGSSIKVVDKETWVAMLQAAGMDETDMRRWHAEFENRAPESHYEFLLSLGICEDEAEQIRQWSRQF
ncbi:MAG: MerR family transcriptional regulator [Desulfuromonadales bacterium]|nr:MerR family transcriptional regulator [Desulfuromonadales bacterium]